MKVIKDSNEQYHSHSSISASGLKTIYKKSVYHLLNQKFKETPAMALVQRCIKLYWSQMIFMTFIR